jgi:ribosomal protein L19E
MSKEDIKQLLRRNFISSKKGKLYSNRTVRRESEGGSTRPLRMEKMMSSPTLLCNLVRLSRGE